ncbi:hypothetical protein SAMN05216359_113137 [Roseateles sp. YR242]|uniref:hypothetical protein n=1 Tax=Roseateles sp. YR242 TaxID=1855305 RepID=UPI0008C6A4F0|nr:hypothetical protein [Roseateles sp. YR242]SEL68022.1 hypothetical protein SAMN05216359_113137 [Roseateles sp. YR242]
MKSNTNELLLRLENADWFCNAGQPLEPSPDVVRVSTWAEALEVCATQASDDARLEAQNELTVQLSARHSAVFKLWNTKVAEFKPLVGKLMDKKLAMPAVQARVPNEAGKTFLGALRWELLGMCMVHEYEDVVSITKYCELFEYWFLVGHFPCGWIGEVPDDMEGAFAMGKLAVL